MSRGRRIKTEESESERHILIKTEESESESERNNLPRFRVCARRITTVASESERSVMNRIWVGQGESGASVGRWNEQGKKG